MSKSIEKMWSFGGDLFDVDTMADAPDKGTFFCTYQETYQVVGEDGRRLWTQTKTVDNKIHALAFGAQESLRKQDYESWDAFYARAPRVSISLIGEEHP